jgi:hypothetical protein
MGFCRGHDEHHSCGDIIVWPRDGPALACISPVFCLDMLGFVGRSGNGGGPPRFMGMWGDNRQNGGEVLTFLVVPTLVARLFLPVRLCDKNKGR